MALWELPLRSFLNHFTRGLGHWRWFRQSCRGYVPVDFSWSQWPVWRAGVQSSQQCKQIALVKEMNSIRIPLLFKPSWAWATLTSLMWPEIGPWPPGFYLCDLGPLLFAPYPSLNTILCRLIGNAVRPALWQPHGIEKRSFCFLTSFLMLSQVSPTRVWGKLLKLSPWAGRDSIPRGP